MTVYSFSVPVLLYLWEDKTVFRIGIKDELTEFIPCIMAYYVIFYFIRTYLLKYLNQVFGIAFLLVAISSFWVLDFNHSVMYAAVPFMRIYYFLFMMLGAMVAIRKYKVVTTLKSGGYALVSLITY